jgi:Protein of unknown function (DUF2423)
MAKSLRSKVKRSFRAKKREEGVYAAASAARLARLNSKLSAIAQTEAQNTEEDQENVDQAQEVPGWWIHRLALLNPDDLHPEDLGSIFGTF